MFVHLSRTSIDLCLGRLQVVRKNTWSKIIISGGTHQEKRSHASSQQIDGQVWIWQIVQRTKEAMYHFGRRSWID